MSESGAPLVKVQDLSVQSKTRDATVHAVNGVSFTVGTRGEYEHMTSCHYAHRVGSAATFALGS